MPPASPPLPQRTHFRPRAAAPLPHRPPPWLSREHDHAGLHSPAWASRRGAGSRVSGLTLRLSERLPVGVDEKGPFLVQRKVD